MKVLYITASGEIGGGNRSLLSIWPMLMFQGVAIHVVCPTPGPMADASRQLGIPCQIVEDVQPEWRQPVQMWTAFRRWSRQLTDAAADIVHANALQCARSVSLATRRMGIPLVCHVRFPPDRDYTRWAFRGLPKPDVFVFNSRALHAEAGERLAQACPAAEQRTVYNAVDLTAFRPHPRRSGPIWRVGVIANLSEIKGHEDFLRMAKVLIDRGLPCEFWIIGTDITRSGYDQHLASLAEQMHISHAVRFLGFRSDITDLIGELDLVVSSSHYESFGRTLVEAMACERAVVATNVGGVPEVVADGVTGVLVPPRDPEALAGAVQRLLEDSPLRERLAHAGRQRAQELFSVEACASQMTDIYTRLGTR